MSHSSMPAHLKRMYVNDARVDVVMATEHIVRYRWACAWLGEEGIGKSAKVLDLPCGSGYGTQMLREADYAVTGVDIEPEAVHYAQAQFGGDYRIGDGTHLQMDGNLFDAVVSFEGIEHIYLPNRLVAEVLRVLKPGGLFLCSTPNVLTWRNRGINRDHIKEYTPEEIYTMFRAEGFQQIRFFGLDTERAVVNNFYESGLVSAIVKLKRKMGLNRPLLKGTLKHTMEKVMVGETSADLTPDSYRVVEDHYAANMMILTARKP
jgi:2-polyprenyl-3-methyl-5-hydroxy-6-metoxy-1,4-benzoquinol methylase